MGAPRPRHVRILRDKKAETPGAADSVVKALRRLFQFAVEEELVDTNPATQVSYFGPVRPEGIPAWSRKDVEKFEAAHPSGSMARLALLLFIEFGQRISDIHRLGPSSVENGKITFTQWKNRRRKPVTLTLPISDGVAEVLRRLPPEQETFLVNEWGRPFSSAASFGNRSRDWCKIAGLSGLSAHGVRKYFSSTLANAEARTREIISFTGHRTSKEVDLYTQSSD
ncbi:tyrosine-type recombinase/integrase [Xanthobacter sp. V4C-4]|uniref:tyrosine-type recombinase/integrase n=1 Tax=Xanthobacter cornucopiae TaxID=3119924 RepID=UPI00372BF45E